ncbi:MAG TPA: CPBP family intramembrane metalloprotease [Planctomycetaceae bacterium]|nr:CPBP family intramembrane metalloprotease [Planctomycetaceae bacterium]HQZ68775.1 CPBP family intramembrane metalloprotease [Planctomycetaceae bacterium]
MSQLSPILAQAAAAAEDPTIGGAITAMMFLLTAFGSLAMIVMWVVRCGQTGHALPAAQRGVLRIPLALTIVAVSLSVLLVVLVLLSAIVPDPVPVSVGGATTTATIETQEADDSEAGATESKAQKTEADAAASSASSETKTETTPADVTAENPNALPQKKSNLTPAQMKRALIQTIGMDLIMFLVFGGVILVAGQAGRVRLKGDATLQPSAQQSGASNPNVARRPAIPSFTGGGMWPDLDDASAIPSIPGYGILGNRPVVVPDAPAAPVPATNETIQATARPAHFNPYEVIGDHAPENQSTPEAAPLPDEPFSFLTELRFATEVFLAAYVPTTALRLIIVLISIGLSGEAPASHPFLEMLNSGISVSMLAMILVTAVFFAPLVEELQFRVVILGGIAQLGRPGLALGVSSILFAFAHGFPDSIALIPLALALGYAYLRRRSYVTVMLVHFLFNGFNMILALVAML